jgi:hypothetical protein
MRRAEFQRWLKAHPKSYKLATIRDYLAECAWVEKHCKINLDLCYDNNQIPSLLSRLTVGAGKDLCVLIDGDPNTNLSSYRSAVRRYSEFRDSGISRR